MKQQKDPADAGKPGMTAGRQADLYQTCKVFHLEAVAEEFIDEIARLDTELEIARELIVRFVRSQTR